MKRQYLSLMAVVALAGSVLGAEPPVVVSTSSLANREGDVVADEVRRLTAATDLQSFAYTSDASWPQGGDASASAVVRVTPMATAVEDWPVARWLPAGESVTLDTGVGEGTAAFSPTAQSLYKAELTIGDKVVETAYFDLTAASDLTAPAALATASVTLAETSVPCTGLPCEPTVSVQAGDDTLEEGRDFVLLYENNVRVGAARVRVVGIGAYRGVVERTFSVVPLAPATVSSSTLTDQSGESTDGVVRVITHTSQLMGVAWSTAADWRAGGDGEAEATVTVSAMSGDAEQDPSSWAEAGQPEPLVSAGMGEGVEPWLPTSRSLYRLTLSVGDEPIETAYFNLLDCEDIAAGTPLDDFALTLSVSSVPCKGRFVEPEVTVSKDDVTLVRGVDYSVEYADNFYAGTATVTVRGIGHYTGSVSTTFEIEPVEPAELAGATKGGVDFDTRIGPDGELHLHLSGERLDYVTFNSAAPAWPAGGDAAVTARVRLAPVSSVDEIPADEAYRTIAEGTGEQVKVGWHMGAKMVRVVLELFDGESWGDPVETRVIRYDRASGTLVIIR